MRTFLLTLALCAFVVHAYVSPDNPEVKRKHVQSCLTEVGLDVSALGRTKIEEYQEADIVKFLSFPTEKRNCFATCMLKKQGDLTPEGKIPDNIAEPVQIKRKYPTTFQDAISACRAETDPCKMGWCLFEIYQLPPA